MRKNADSSSVGFIIESHRNFTGASSVQYTFYLQLVYALRTQVDAAINKASEQLKKDAN